MPGRGGEDDENLVSVTLRDNGRNTSQGPGNYVSALCPVGGGPDDNDAQAGHLIVPERARALVGSMHKRHDDDTDTLIPTLSASLGHYGHSSPRGDGNDPLVAFALRADPGGTGQGHDTTYPGGVRRLTPLECERLQGFPDGWTCLCGEGHRGSSFCTCSDSPRYRQLGNAVTVNVAEWIAQRVLEADR
jgi:site-specific DNA-cytosine methylase